MIIKEKTFFLMNFDKNSTKLPLTVKYKRSAGFRSDSLSANRNFLRSKEAHT